MRRRRPASGSASPPHYSVANITIRPLSFSCRWRRCRILNCSCGDEPWPQRWQVGGQSWQTATLQLTHTHTPILTHTRRSGDGSWILKLTSSWNPWSQVLYFLTFVPSFFPSFPPSFRFILFHFLFSRFPSISPCFLFFVVSYSFYSLFNFFFPSFLDSFCVCFPVVLHPSFLVLILHSFLSSHLASLLPVLRPFFLSCILSSFLASSLPALHPFLLPFFLSSFLSSSHHLSVFRRFSVLNPESFRCVASETPSFSPRGTAALSNIKLQLRRHAVTPEVTGQRSILTNSSHTKQTHTHTALLQQNVNADLQLTSIHD